MELSGNGLPTLLSGVLTLMRSPRKLVTNQSNETLNQRIRAELVHLIYSQAKFAIIGSCLVATLLFYGLHFAEPSKILLLWYLALLAVALLRFVVVKLYFLSN